MHYEPDSPYSEGRTANGNRIMVMHWKRSTFPNLPNWKNDPVIFGKAATMAALSMCQEIKRCCNLQCGPMPKVLATASLKQRPDLSVWLRFKNKEGGKAIVFMGQHADTKLYFFEVAFGACPVAKEKLSRRQKARRARFPMPVAPVGLNTREDPESEAGLARKALNEAEGPGPTTIIRDGVAYNKDGAFELVDGENGTELKPIEKGEEKQ